MHIGHIHETVLTVCVRLVNVFSRIHREGWNFETVLKFQFNFLIGKHSHQSYLI